MIFGYDAIDASLIPRDAGFVAGYWDGDYANVGSLRATFPELDALGRVFFYTGAHGQCDPSAEGADIEPGNAGPELVVGYVRTCVHPRPVLYADRSDMLTIVGNLHNAGYAIGPAGPPRPFRLLVAHPSGQAHICGPATCGFPVECDGTQWAFNPGGVNIDADVVRDDFFQSKPTPHPLKEDDVIHAVVNQDGRIEVFVEKADSGEVFHAYQVAKNGGWAGAQEHVRNAEFFSLGTPGKS